jgi:hypothetical protein
MIAVSRVGTGTAHAEPRHLARIASSVIEQGDGHERT